MITSTRARAIIAVAETQAKTMGIPVNVAVLDAGAQRRDDELFRKFLSTAIDG